MLFNGEIVGDGTGFACDIAVDPNHPREMEAVKVTYTEQSAGLFEPPADFQKFAAHARLIEARDHLRRVDEIGGRRDREEWIDAARVQLGDRGRGLRLLADGAERRVAAQLARA